MSRSTLFFALPVRSSWVSDGTVSHRAIGSPPPAADPRGEQSSIRALSTWNRATVGRRIKLLGHPFISGAIRTLCAPSVSRETSAALVLCQTLTEHTNGMRGAIVRGPRQAIQISAAIGEQFSATDSDGLPTAGSLQSGSHLLYPQGLSILLPPPEEDASVSTVT